MNCKGKLIFVENWRFERDILKKELDIAHKRRLSEDNSVQKSKETYVFLTNDPEQAIASESVEGNQKTSSVGR